MENCFFLPTTQGMVGRFPVIRFNETLLIFAVEFTVHINEDQSIIFESFAEEGCWISFNSEKQLVTVLVNFYYHIKTYNKRFQDNSELEVSGQKSVFFRTRRSV